MLNRSYHNWIWALFAITLATQTIAESWSHAQDDVMLTDFEQDTYGSWTVEGKAFGSAPAKGTLPGQMQVDGFQGRQLANSFVDGDDSTGSLTSPTFRIERRFISFLIGGGKNPEKLAIQLLIDNKIVRTATGLNDRPGGSERLESQYWDVSEFHGQDCSIRIVDNAQGSWGHINIDHIVQSNNKPKGYVQNVERTIKVDRRFVHFPIKNGGPKRIVSLLVDGNAIVRNDIELADESPDWWAPMDVSAWNGKAITVRVDKLHEDSEALNSIQTSDRIMDGESMYREPLRGQFHFSARRGWNNDPNGCVYYNGEYHLFFQHNPYGWNWGNMHWGHAVSKDLIHWEELGDKLMPDEMGPMFSGSAVVDWNNTSGFGRDGKPPLVLFYTAAGNPTTQCIAYSNDGRQFTKYSGNPVLGEITGGNRDPKVIWHAPSGRWVMVLYVESHGKHTVHFYNSSNLREWTLSSVVNGDSLGGGYLFECPDFFELPIDGDASRKKWVLLGANSEYAIGEFDGKRFLPDSTRLRGHRGKGFYAAQSFSDVPDGRRVFIGWWQTETKGMMFNQSMTVPLELALRQTDDGPRLAFWPVKELKSLRKKTFSLVSANSDSITLNGSNDNALKHIEAELAEVEITFKPVSSKVIKMSIRGVEISYDVNRQEIIVAGMSASAPLINGEQKVVAFCDRTGIELFASQGLCYIPLPMNLDSNNLRFEVTSPSGETLVTSLHVHELQPAWNAK